MADNYLERQRELYEARKAAWEKKKKYGRKGTAMKHSALPFPADSTEKTVSGTANPSVTGK